MSRSPTELILSKLYKVKSTGQDKWRACCPAHEDNTPSLSIKKTIKDDLELVLIHCFCGCTPIEIVGALGLDLGDLYEKPKFDASIHKGQIVRRPFVSSDAFDAIQDATSAIYLLACDMQAGRKIDMQVLAKNITLLNNVADTCFEQKKFINPNFKESPTKNYAPSTTPASPTSVRTIPKRTIQPREDGSMPKFLTR